MYTNIENTIFQDVKIYIYPRKFYLMNLNFCMPKVGFWTIRRKTQQIKMTTDN